MKEMKLKTLNDLKATKVNDLYNKGINDGLDLVKAEAVKWIKFDKNLIKNKPLLKIEKDIAKRFVQVWMYRLNITEEDLK